MDFDKRPPRITNPSQIRDPFTEKIPQFSDIEQYPEYVMVHFFSDAINVTSTAWLRLDRIKTGENLEPVVVHTITEQLQEKCRLHGVNVETAQAVIKKDSSYQESFQDVDQHIARYNEACQKRPYDIDILYHLLKEIRIALNTATKKHSAKSVKNNQQFK